MGGGGEVVLLQFYAVTVYDVIMFSAVSSLNHSLFSVNVALIHELLVVTNKMSSFQRLSDGNTALATGHDGDMNETDKCDEQGQTAKYDDHLTPAEKRYLQQWERIDTQRMVKMASKSHRDRIQEFNQYLANLSEHYDIPKVGPGQFVSPICQSGLCTSSKD